MAELWDAANSNAELHLVPESPHAFVLFGTAIRAEVTAYGRRFRVLSIVDDVTRECLAAVVDTSISRRRTVREPGDLIARRGAPKMIVGDNGIELTSNAILAWFGDVRNEWHYIAPG